MRPCNGGRAGSAAVRPGAPLPMGRARAAEVRTGRAWPRALAATGPSGLWPRWPLGPARRARTSCAETPGHAGSDSRRSPRIPPQPALPGASARRRRARRLCGLFAALLVALGAAAAGAPAIAQTVTLVSNTGQTNSTSVITRSGKLVAQQFTTGNNGTSYTLSEIVVNIGEASTATPAFALYDTSDANGLAVPGTKIVDLNGSVATAGLRSFTPATSTTLAAQTKYFVVFHTTSTHTVTYTDTLGALSTTVPTTIQLTQTRSNNVDSNTSRGWDIAGISVYSYIRVSGAWHGASRSVEIAVKGTVTLTNFAATGKPAIASDYAAARVDNILTASKGTIADDNGVPSGAFTYQWVRVDGTTETDISGATSATYTLTAADAGNTVKVKMSFTDDNGYPETRTSDAFPASGTVPEGPLRVLDIEFSDPGPDNLYTENENLDITVVLNRAATLDTAKSVIVPLRGVFCQVNVGSQVARYHSGSGTARITFRCRIRSTRGTGGASTWVRVPRDAVHLAVAGSETYRINPSFEQRTSVHGVAGPRITDVTIGSPGPDGLWTAGESLEITYTFSEPVTLHSDSPQAQIWKLQTVGRRLQQRLTDVQHAAGSSTIVFSRRISKTTGRAYEVGQNSLVLGRNGYIVSAQTGALANLTHRAKTRAAALVAPCGSFPNEIWCATMTVGSSPSGNTLGVTSRFGSFSTRQFSYSGTTYHVNQLNYHNVARQLTFGIQTQNFSQLNRAGLRLYVGPTSYFLPTTRSALAGGLWTNAADPGLSVGDRVTVRLTGPAASSSQVQVDPPTVDGTPSVSGAGGDAQWSEGETVGVTVTFSEAVDVDTTRGTPSIGIGLGGTAARSATYASGTGTTELVFEYTLVSGDGTHGTMAVAPDSLALNGGTIQSTGGVDAVLAHNGTVALGTTSRSTGPETVFQSVPKSHDGGTAFTLGVQFGGTPAGLSAKRDAASIFEATGGSVTGARVTSGGQRPVWEVTVAPDGPGNVTVRIPARACGEAHAVCIGGRALAEAVEAAVPGPPLTAQFTQAPAAHDGSNEFLLHFEFSHEPSGYGYRTVRDALFDVEGGRIEKARRLVKRRNLRWEMTVVPDGDGAVTLAARATTDCATAHAACDAGGRKFAGGLALTVPGPATLAAVSEPATLSSVSVSAPAQTPVTEGAALDFTLTRNGDTAQALTVTVSVSETGSVLDGTPPATATFAAGSASAVLSVASVDDEAAEDASTVTVALSPGGGYTVDTSANTAQGVVESDDIEPITARFTQVPTEHDGSSAFLAQFEFSHEPQQFSYRTVRDALFEVGGGRIGKARRLTKGSNLGWEVTVVPSGNGAVTLTARATADCAAQRAVCDAAGRKFDGELARTVRGPALLSVADATVEEAEGATLEFIVTMSRAHTGTTTVEYATSDGTARAGEDYTASSGTLSFAPDETAKTVAVTVLDDAHDEGSETMTLTLSSPSGAKLDDARATGTIENTDHMPQAWLSRFGRTVAEQVLDAVAARLRVPPRAGVEATLAGQALPRWDGEAGSDAADGMAARRKAGKAEAQAEVAALSDWLQGGRVDAGDGRRAAFSSRAVTERDLLTGSSFALTTEASGGAGGLVSLWGRGAVLRFDGREGDLSLDGEVVSAMLGADWTRDAWTTGLLLSHSRGEGGYRGAGAGTVSSSMTGLYPYGRTMVNERVTLWGVAGYGAGTLTLTPKNPETGKDDGTIRTDMDLAMAALGVRGVAVEAPTDGGFELAVTSDGMVVRTSSEKAVGLVAAEAEVTRLRLGLEGSWRGIEAGGGALRPRLEVGVRHDGGDAETGFGLDLGGGLAWSHPANGVSAEMSGRALLTHESRGFRDRGLSGSFAWDPGQGSGRGPKVTLTQTMGAPARGGMDALLGRGTLAGLAANDNGDELENRRLELKLGYGLPAFGDRFTSTPELGLGLSNGHRDYRLGWRFNLAEGGPTALELRLEASRRESANDDTEPEHGVGLRLTARW